MTPIIRWLLVLAGTAAVGTSSVGCVPGLSRGEQAADDELSVTYLEGDSESQNYLLEVRIAGPILNRSDSADFFGLTAGVTYAYQVQDLLEQAAKDDRIQGLFLRLSTPGGTVVGSNVIYDALVAYRAATENPIYAYVDGLSASGGVWSMVAADTIYAAPGSIVGSIGVLGPTLVYFDDPVAVDGGLLGGGVTTRNGIRQYVVSAGKGKDLGNPFRQPTDAELQVLQANIDNEYDNFVRHLAATRGIAESVLRDEIGAYIFDTQQAEAYNLIDDTLGYQEAIAALADTLDLGDDYQLVRVRREEPGLIALLLGQGRSQLSYEQQQALVQQDLCELTQASLLVYYGDVTALCPDQYR